MKKTIKQQFQDWCLKNDLNQFQAFSLAFVDEITAYGILNDYDGNIPSKFRLWKLTQLPCFQLSKDELKEYNSERQKKIAVISDEQIMTHLISLWNKNPSFFTLDDCLSLGVRKSRKKKEMREYLLKKYFNPQGDKNAKKTLKLTPPKIHSRNYKKDINLKSETDTNMIDIPIFEKFNLFLNNTVFNSKKEGLELFKKDNSKLIKNTLGLLNILMEEDPFEAAKTFKNFKL
jgi:parallel beta-helix repeat protein